MIEIAICVCLAIMGIYFFKSTDLPKELKERSSQINADSSDIGRLSHRKMSFPKEAPKKLTVQVNQDKLADLNLRKKTAELKFHNEAIDKLTLTITTLEQEIKVNNERNSEIQKMIDSHLISLQLLQEKIISLS